MHARAHNQTHASSHVDGMNGSHLASWHVFQISTNSYIGLTKCYLHIEIAKLLLVYACLSLGAKRYEVDHLFTSAPLKFSMLSSPLFASIQVVMSYGLCRRLSH